MEAVLLTLLVLFVVAAVLGVYATVKAVGAAKRGVDRTIAQARRSVEETALRARSHGQPGPAGELAQLRLRLRTSMRATQEVLTAEAGQDASLEESVRLFERLSVHGRELEEHLRLAERDPDRARVAEHLPELRERTDRITKSADSLRWAARDRARRFAEDDLSALSAEIDMESGALRHWAPVTEPTRGPAGERGTGGTPVAEPDAEPGTSGTPRRELGPADPRRWSVSPPWRKPQGNARPETTN